jgi:Na+/H+-translocating membrane pyrophosphatase
MKPTIIEQCRAYLYLAGLAAILIQAVIFIAILVFSVPQSVFTTPAFHVGVAAAIAGFTWGLRHLAREAFRNALASRHAHLVGWERRTVALSAQCPRRGLVLLHVRLNPRSFDPALP